VPPCIHRACTVNTNCVRRTTRNSQVKGDFAGNNLALDTREDLKGEREPAADILIMCRECVGLLTSRTLPALYDAVPTCTTRAPPREHGLRHSGSDEPQLRGRRALSPCRRTRFDWSRTDLQHRGRLHRCAQPLQGSTRRCASTGLEMHTRRIRSSAPKKPLIRCPRPADKDQGAGTRYG
jgi:hypothetical protein